MAPSKAFEEMVCSTNIDQQKEGAGRLLQFLPSQCGTDDTCRRDSCVTSDPFIGREG